MAIDLKALIEGGVHFGHQTWRWNPKMAPFIWGKKNGVYLIDISKTAFQMEKAAEMLESVARDGKQILFVGTKSAARPIIERIGREINMPTVVDRWVGGTLTNYPQVRKSVAKLLHLEDVLSKSDRAGYTKKELGGIQKLVERLKKNVGGIRMLRWPVGAIVIVDIRKEMSAVREARVAGVPIIALVDTNCDPSLVDFPIPANDDVSRSIKVVLDVLVDAVKKGAAEAKKVETATETPAEDMINQLLEQALGGEEEGGEKKKDTKKPVRRPIVGKKPFSPKRS
jgi:small subunit ribosomal protein S2